MVIDGRLDLRLVSRRTLSLPRVLATAVKCLAALVIAGNVAILSSVYKRDSMAPIDDWAVAVSALQGNGNCSAVSSVTDAQFLASGWTKAVYKARLNGKEVAVKTVNVNGHDYNVCQRAATATQDEVSCYKRVAAKILKEIALLRALNHPNVLQVLEYCVPQWEWVGEEKSAPVALVTELGQPLDIISLLQMSWEDRLRIVLGLTHLLSALASSNLVMNDFRRQQFVLVNGELKLTDVDDATVSVEDPPCAGSHQCTVDGINGTIEGPCVAGRCLRHGERMNIYNAGRHFATFLLPHSAPRQLRPLVDEVVTAFANVSWDSATLADRLDAVASLYVSGKYLGRRHPKQGGYKRLTSSDLPGMYDYRCQLSLSGNGCTLSVFDAGEAEEICDEDPVCKAFVVTADRTWTGRTIVHFKNNFSDPVVHSPRTTLYLKEV